MEDKRKFLKILAGVSAGITLAGTTLAETIVSDRLGDVLPKRKLGHTNEFVTLLGTGGFHVGWTTERDAQEVVEASMEGGIRFFDTAESYANGTSEIRYGKIEYYKRRRPDTGRTISKYIPVLRLRTGQNTQSTQLLVC
ncbi:MAG: aldo/keto reductase [Mariniphaga sp.]